MGTKNIQFRTIRHRLQRLHSKYPYGLAIENECVSQGIIGFLVASILWVVAALLPYLWTDPKGVAWANIVSLAAAVVDFLDASVYCAAWYQYQFSNNQAGRTRLDVNFALISVTVSTGVIGGPDCHLDHSIQDRRTAGMLVSLLHDAHMWEPCTFLLASSFYILVSYCYLKVDPYGVAFTSWMNIVGAFFLILNNIYCFLSHRLSACEDGRPATSTDWWLVANWIYIPACIIYLLQAILMFDYMAFGGLIDGLNLFGALLFLFNAIAFYLDYYS